MMKNNYDVWAYNTAKNRSSARIIGQANQSILTLCLFCIIGLLPFSALGADFASWTGIKLTIGDETIPIVDGDNALQLQPRILTIEVEQSSSSGVRIGATLGEQTSTITNGDSSLDVEADAAILGVYLRYRQSINDYLSIPLSLSINNTTSSGGDESTSIEWLEKKATLGLSLQWDKFRITSYLISRQLDGDYESPGSSFSFKTNSSATQGIDIDYFIETNDFIRFSTTKDADQTFQVSFARVF